MEQFIALAQQLPSRLSAAASIEEMWAAKAAFDAEFAAEYKAVVIVPRQIKEAKVAEAIAALEALKAEAV